MSEQKMVTEREAVQRERYAYEHGVVRLYNDTAIALTNETSEAFRKAMSETTELYPIPKVTRPRVVRDPHAPNAAWRYVDVLMVRAAPDLNFYPIGSHGGWYHPSKERVAMWADLLANPTEEVEPDADA